MVTRATITFEHPATETPVYVVTDMSTPPWEPLEMKDSGKKTEAGDTIFLRDFEDVVEGNHQYKIRIGDGNWVLDTSKDTASDGAGHLNNIVHAATVKYSHDDSTLETSREKHVGDKKERHDSTQSPSDIPFLVVDTIQDEEQPRYGGTVPERFPIDKKKREADVDPDYDSIVAATGGEKEQQVDDLSHDKKSAPFDSSIETTELDNPLVFPHEVNASSDQNGFNVAPLSHELVMGTESDGLSDTSHRPLLTSGDSHTIDLTPTPSEESRMNDFEDDEDVNELDRVPTLSHEQSHPHDNEDTNELDRIPTSAHDQVISTDDEDELTGLSELDRAPSFSYESGSLLAGSSTYDFGNPPRLRHESPVGLSNLGRDQMGASSGSERHRPSFGGGGPAFPYEELSEERTRVSPTNKGSAIRSSSAGSGSDRDTDPSKASFGRTSGSFFLKRRTTQSSLPNTMARSDAEDENLNDPSLEPFPVDREQIFQRINTVSAHFPEDHPEGSFMSVHSPDVLSQACSSVDLAPVKSHTSLMSIPESGLQEEDDEESSSLPSPVMKIKFSDAEVGLKEWVSEDDLETPMPHERRLELALDSEHSPTDGLTMTNVDRSSRNASAINADATQSAEKTGPGSNDDATSETVPVDPNTVTSPARILHDAREAFITKGLSLADESRSKTEEDPASSPYWKQRSPEKRTVETSSTISERTESSSTNANNNDNDNEHHQRQQGNPPEQRPVGLLGRLLNPVRHTFARCLGRKPEDVPHAAGALFAAGMFAAVNWCIISSGTVSLPAFLTSARMADWGVKDEWVGSGFAFFLALGAFLAMD